MILTFADDAEEVGGSVRDVLRAECGREAVLAHIESGHAFDAGLWARVAALGWMGAGVPEAHGGIGLGFEALAVFYRELGHACAPLPFLGTMLFASAIAQGGHEIQRQTLLPAIAEGALIGAVSSPLDPPALRMREDHAGLVLSGRLRIADAGAARMLVVRAGATDWVLLDTTQDGFAVEPIAQWDQTRNFGQITLDGLSVPHDRKLAGIDAEMLADHAALAIACDSLGGAEAIFAITLDYLKTRQQFGRLIGSFQALKHRAADHQAALAGAGALVAEAVSLFGLAAAKPASISPSLAKAHATDVASMVARDCVQLHGGIGYTWDHPCHLYLKRALLNATLFGSAADAYDRAAALVARRIAA